MPETCLRKDKQFKQLFNAQNTICAAPKSFLSLSKYYFQKNVNGRKDKKYCQYSQCAPWPQPPRYLYTVYSQIPTYSVLANNVVYFHCFSYITALQKIQNSQSNHYSTEWLEFFISSLSLRLPAFFIRFQHPEMAQPVRILTRCFLFYHITYFTFSVLRFIFHFIVRDVTATQQNHISYRKFQCNEFVQNSLQCNMGMIIFDPRVIMAVRGQKH